jgi:DNA-binding MarR family transcriptional regulator
MDVIQRYVLKPKFNNLSEYRLSQKDILIYTTIRSFFNTQDNFCYPSYATIAKRSGTSVHIVTHSVKRLECAGFIDVWKVGKFKRRHYYKFNDFDNYQKIPYSLFDADDLTAYEKSILLIIAEYSNSLQQIPESIGELASKIGMTYRSLMPQIKSLILKGYVVLEVYENPLDQTLTKYFKLTVKLRWNFPVNSSTA